MNIYLQKKPRRINSFSVTLALIVLVAGYAGYFYLPLWWPVFQLTGIMRGICNEAYRNVNDEDLMKKLMAESKRVRLPGLTAENFEFTRVPYEQEELASAKGLRPELRGKRCELYLSYERTATWPLLGKTSTFHFEREVVSDLSFVDWDDSKTKCTCVTVGSSDEEARRSSDFGVVR
ncbi:MAG: hypothetical protein H6729_08845 [Deltaproteobacteria bacterium]|nr:hypothetical protein [Deltaproteobacteria bacterium]